MSLSPLTRRFQLPVRRWFTVQPPCFANVREQSYRPTSTLEKVCLATKSCVGAIRTPDDGDHVADLGEVTGREALIKMWKVMQQSNEGRELLKHKPVLYDFEPKWLDSMPEGSLGKRYASYMRDNNFEMSGRREVRYVDDPELAYVMLRYRQTHDIGHAAYSLSSTLESEVALKLIEMMTTGLPVSSN
eukprot:Selendium_serpulae@DN5752_c0_g2_i1.p1